MSRSSHKRSYDSSQIQEDSEFGDYGRRLNYQGLQYLRDGAPQPGFLDGRVIRVTPEDGLLSIEIIMNEENLVLLRFQGDFAARLLRMAENDSNIRISTRGAVVEHKRPMTLRYSNGAHVVIETALNAWADRGN